TFTRRVKQDYLAFGCRVTPALDELLGPFMVEHPDGRTSIVAVAYVEDGAPGDLDGASASVKRWLESARKGGEDAEGYVVLAPEARRADRERVLEEGLYPIDYRERRSIGLDTLEQVVRCVMGAEDVPTSLDVSLVQGAEARPVDEALTAF